MKTINNNIIKSVVFSIIILASYTGNAQSKWNTSIGLQSQFASLKSNSSITEDDTDAGLGINLGISYQLTEKWSIHSGVGLLFINSQTSINNLSDYNNATDTEGEDFEFRYNITNYNESYKNNAISIPLAVQYENNIGTKTKFYSKLGLSLLLFTKSTMEATADELSTSGYYERFNAELHNPTFAGFGTFNNVDLNEQDFKLKNSVNAFFELGIKQNITKNQWVYIGAFLEYGINNLITNTNKPLVEYDSSNPTDFIANSSLGAINQTSTQFADVVRLNSFGVRLGYEFSSLKLKKE